MELLRGVNRSGTTVLLVTHDVKVAAQADRVLFMLDGRIAAEKQLGKYVGNGADGKAREEALSGWLLERGF
jgi:putative ABC transport system ATP-binding protein